RRERDHDVGESTLVSNTPSWRYNSAHVATFPASRTRVTITRLRAFRERYGPANLHRGSRDPAPVDRHAPPSVTEWPQPGAGARDPRSARADAQGVATATEIAT